MDPFIDFAGFSVKQFLDEGKFLFVSLRGLSVARVSSSAAVGSSRASIVFVGVFSFGARTRVDSGDVALFSQLNRSLRYGRTVLLVGYPETTHVETRRGRRSTPTWYYCLSDLGGGGGGGNSKSLNKSGSSSRECPHTTVRATTVSVHRFSVRGNSPAEAPDRRRASICVR